MDGCQTAADARRRLRDLEILAPEMEMRVENDYQAALEHADEDYVIDVRALRNRRRRPDRLSQLLKQTQNKDEAKEPEVLLTLGKRDFRTGITINRGQRTCGRRTRTSWTSRTWSGSRNACTRSSSAVVVLQSPPSMQRRHLMKLWGADLDARPAAVKLSTEGKHARCRARPPRIPSPRQHHVQADTGVHQTAAQDTQDPRLRQPSHTCSHAPQSLEESLAVLFAGMITALLQREYIKANDKYLQIAIGNAPWPIGSQ